MVLMIPITSVRLGHEEERAALEVLRSGMLAQGARVAEFEQKFAAMHGVANAVAVNNGTTALVAALQALDLEPGDEVITSPFTFVATINAILETGATVKFADIRDDDFNIDPDAVASAVTPKTKVIMPVHLYGQMADMGRLSMIASRHDLRIVEDSAQSHGATFDGKSAGSYDIGTFSLYATKNITTGEGGVITTDDDAVADRLRVLRNQGMRARYEYELAGHNYRLTDLQAAIGIPQLDRYSETVAKRQRNAARLSESLSGIEGIRVPRELPGRTHVWHQYTVRVLPEASMSRDDFVAGLNDRGIGAGVYYPRLLWDYDAYRDHPQVNRAKAPIAGQVAREVVSLPVHTGLSDDDLETIVRTVRDLLGAGR
jgi:dTDP-4-amino-4,6-dideoxygalactose transaminase